MSRNDPVRERRKRWKTPNAKQETPSAKQPEFYHTCKVWTPTHSKRTHRDKRRHQRIATKEGINASRQNHLFNKTSFPLHTDTSFSQPIHVLRLKTSTFVTKSDIYIHTYIYTYIQIYKHTYMQTYPCIHTYIHTCIDTCIDRQKRVLGLVEIASASRP